MVPPSASDSPRSSEKRSRCSCFSRPACLPELLAGVEHRRRPARPGGALAPVGAHRVELVEGEHPLGVGEPLDHGQRRVLLVQGAQLVAEDHPLLGGRGVDQHRVRHGVAAVERAHHRHHRGDAAAGDEEQRLLRRRVGEGELTGGCGEADDRAGLETADQVVGEEALRHRPHGDGDRALAAHRDRAQRVGPPVEATLHLDADADVLAGLVVEGPPPPGLDDQGGGVVGLGDDPLDASAQLAGRPERVDQRQVVVGVERSREPAREVPDALPVEPCRGLLRHPAFPSAVPRIGKCN